MALSLLGLLLIIFSIVSFFRKRHDRLQQDTEENFWAREHAANHVRRQDISGLPYISIPFDNFSIGAFSDETLTELGNTLETFRDKKILNLTGQTNTDLKLLYGPANLQILTEYDQNFSDLLHVLTDYSNRLMELEHTEAAIPVLEFCIDAGSDVSAHYTMLGTYYKEQGLTSQLEVLREKASALNSLTKSSILKKLDAIISE